MALPTRDAADMIFKTLHNIDDTRLGPIPASVKLLTSYFFTLYARMMYRAEFIDGFELLNNNNTCRLTLKVTEHDKVKKVKCIPMAAESNTIYIPISHDHDDITNESQTFDELELTEMKTVDEVTTHFKAIRYNVRQILELEEDDVIVILVTILLGFAWKQDVSCDEKLMVPFIASHIYDIWISDESEGIKIMTLLHDNKIHLYKIEKTS